MVLGGYIAAAYRINYVLDFAVFGPPLIVAAAVTASAAPVAHSASLNH
jgi:hypothetical protein